MVVAAVAVVVILAQMEVLAELRALGLRYPRLEGPEERRERQAVEVLEERE